MSQEKEGIERDEHLVHKAYLERGAAVLCCSALKLEQMTHAHITHVSAGSVKILFVQENPQILRCLSAEKWSF